MQKLPISSLHNSIGIITVELFPEPEPPKMITCPSSSGLLHTYLCLYLPKIIPVGFTDISFLSTVGYLNSSKPCIATFRFGLLLSAILIIITTNTANAKDHTINCSFSIPRGL